MKLLERKTNKYFTRKQMRKRALSSFLCSGIPNLGTKMATQTTTLLFLAVSEIARFLV